MQARGLEINWVSAALHRVVSNEFSDPEDVTLIDGATLKIWRQVPL